MGCFIKEKKMKIGIVTVYKSENCGSFLQAWALKTTLEGMGCEVFFIPYERSSGDIKNIGWQVAKCYIKLRFKTAHFLLKRKVEFYKAQRNFAIMNGDEKIDAFIFGSDTIWNFENIFFQNSKDFFVGKGIVQPRYAYAVSAGQTSSRFFESDMDVKSELANFDKISVRDEFLKEILEKLYPEKQILRVLDPTLLLDSDDYIKLTNQTSFFGNYLFVYYFGNMPNQLFTNLFHFAHKQGLKMIKMGFPDKRFDINVTNSPWEFIQYFSSASYIVTNTFHGCIFSVLFNKQFITDEFEKKKIEDFISRYELQTQYIMDPSTVEAKLTETIDYRNINTKIKEDRKISLQFLQEIVAKFE